MENQSVNTDNNLSRTGQDPMKEFQLAELSISEKSSQEFGLKMSKKIWSYIPMGFGGYYYNRNARFAKNRNFANGRIDVQQMFQDRFQFNGKQNYIRLVWQTLQIVNRIVSGLVGRWMQRNEKIQVKAIDSLSLKDKQEQYKQIEFIMANRAKLEELQQQSGMQILPQNQEIPADKEELALWQAQFQRLPEEILYELGCNDVLASNGWFDVMKEKMLHDSAEVGLVGTKTWMDEQGVIHVDWIKPENAIYSATEFPDFRDTSWRGQAPSLKISQLRRDYGKEFHPNDPLALTEEQLFSIAQKAKEYKAYTNLRWDSTWNSLYLRPYDEWNVRSVEFELKTVDSDPYTVTTTKSTGTTYTQKGYPTTASGKKREKPSDNQKLISDTNWNIYEGVYLPDSDILLKWGLKKNMIRPQDPKEIGNAEFSYSFYMPQLYEMMNLAIPEKIEAAVDGMILALLKIQQIVARLVPNGWQINETALNDIDYGVGNAAEPINHAKSFFQTGLLYYKGTDAEGNRVEPPIKELVNNGFVGQMDGLIKDYQFWYQTLKDELGEDPNLISAALQPRVTTGNVEVSQSQAEFATDSFYSAYANCIKDTARKVSCLLKDSVTYGAKAYRDLVKPEDIGDRQFTTEIQFLPTQQQVADFDALLNQAMNTTPELTMFLNPFQLRRIAQEDVKLAESLFYQATKKMLLWKESTTAQNQQATIQGQIQSAQAAEQSKQQTEQIKGQIDLERDKIQGETANKTATLALVSALLSKEQPIPPYLQPLVNTVVANIMLPLAAENEEQKQAMQAQMQQAIQAQQGGQMPQQQSGQEEQQEQPDQQQQIQQPQPQAA